MSWIWMTQAPAFCDLCQVPIKTEFIDGRSLKGGRWACMCPACHKEVGVGLGTGLGQQYILNTVTGEWTKEEG